MALLSISDDRTGQVTGASWARSDDRSIEAAQEATDEDAQEAVEEYVEGAAKEAPMLPWINRIAAQAVVLRFVPMMTARHNQKLFACFVVGCALLLQVMACADEPETDPYGLPAGYCCCEFVIEGDILTEDALPIEGCAAQTSGMCITVDPNRFTPHPCCPNATGERCGDGS